MLKKLILLLMLITGYTFCQNSETASGNDYLMKIRVTLGGNTDNSGTYSAVKGEKLDQFVTRMNNFIKDSKFTEPDLLDSAAQNKSQLLSMQSLRGIKLLRKGNSKPVLVDLYKFRQTGNQDLNPYLENDDIILFSTFNLRTSIVEIGGAVNKPGQYLYMEGDKLQDLLAFAGGLDPVYEKIPVIEVSRLTPDGETEKVFKLAPDADFNLRPGDRVLVNAGENNKKFYKLKVTGEVNNPGQIYITKNSTNLYNVIKKAGGIKPTADLSKSELIRGSIFSKESGIGRNLDNLMMRRMSAITDEDSVVFSIDNMIRLQRGNGVIDFAKVSDSTSFDAGFIVKDGDVLNIPAQEDLVYVFGQINNPGYAKYAKGAKVGFYLKSCGGVGETAKNDIYLIKAQSRSWHLLDEQSETAIEPGDYIWVSKKPIRDFDYYLTKVGSIASIVGGIATTVILLISL